MQLIDIHYVGHLFHPLPAPVTVFAMTKAARIFLVTARHEMGMPTCACDGCRSCQP